MHPFNNNKISCIVRQNNRILDILDQLVVLFFSIESIIDDIITDQHAETT